MTGSDFVLSVLASFIATVLYEFSRRVYLRRRLLKTSSRLEQVEAVVIKKFLALTRALRQRKPSKEIQVVSFERQRHNDLLSSSMPIDLGLNSIHLPGLTTPHFIQRLGRVGRRR